MENVVMSPNDNQSLLSWEVAEGHSLARFSEIMQISRIEVTTSMQSCAYVQHHQEVIFGEVLKNSVN
jgi:hypothetical protein